MSELDLLFTIIDPSDITIPLNDYNQIPSIDPTINTIIPVLNTLVANLKTDQSGNGKFVSKSTPQTISANHTFSGDVTFSGGIGGVSKEDVGLGNVNNTSDENKPVSTATTTQLNLKANLSGGNSFQGLQSFLTTPQVTSYTAPNNNLQLTAKKYCDDTFVSKSGSNTLTGRASFNDRVIIGDGVGNDLLTINSNISAGGSTITPAQLATASTRYNIDTNLDTLLNGKPNLTGDNVYTGNNDFQASTTLITTHPPNDNSNKVASTAYCDSQVRTIMETINVFNEANDFTHSVTVPTKTPNDNSNNVASTEYCDAQVQLKISELVGSSPELLNTLEEISTSLNGDPSFSNTILGLLSQKSGLESDNSFSGHNTFTNDNTFEQQNVHHVLPIASSTCNINALNRQFVVKDFCDTNYLNRSSNSTANGNITFNESVVLGSNDTKTITLNGTLRANNTNITPAQLARINRYNIDTNLSTLLDAKVNLNSNNTLTGIQNFNNNIIIGDGVGGDIMTINANISANSQTITPSQLSRINRYNIDTNLDTLLNVKANTSQIVSSNNWTVNIGVNTLSSVISAIGSSTVQNVMMSAGQHSDTANPLILSSTNLNISGPVGALSSNITLYTAPVTIQGSTVQNVRLSNIQFTSSAPVIINGTQGKHYFTNCTFTGNFSLQGSTTNHITFYYCTFSANFTIPSTFAGVCFIYMCDFQGSTVTLNNASSQQIFINSCVGLPSLSLNATLIGFNNTSSASSISTNSLNVLGTTTFPNNSINSSSINNTSFVDLSNTQTVGGSKTFSSIPICSVTPTTNNHLTNKAYVDSKTTLPQILSNDNVFTGENRFDDVVQINDMVMATGSSVPATIQFVDNTSALLGMIKMNKTDKVLTVANESDTTVATINKTGTPTANTDLLTKSYMDGLTVKPNFFVFGRSATTIANLDLSSGVIYVNFTDSAKIRHYVNFELFFSYHWSSANSLSMHPSDQGIHCFAHYNVTYSKVNDVWRGVPRLLSGDSGILRRTGHNPFQFGTLNGRPAITYNPKPNTYANANTTSQWISMVTCSARICSSNPATDGLIINPSTSTQSATGGAWFSLT